MERLILQRSVGDAIISHARREAPIESCGYCGMRDGVAVSYHPLRNLDEKNDHFTFDPAEQFALIRELRKSGLKAGAVVHSHPESPARPSSEDLRLLADPSLVYIIVSLAKPEADLGAFRIIDGIGTPVAIDIQE